MAEHRGFASCSSYARLGRGVATGGCGGFEMLTRRAVLLSVGGAAIVGAGAAGFLFGTRNGDGEVKKRIVSRNFDLVHEDGDPLLTEGGERLSWS